MNDYGHIDDETPSLAISLYKEYRSFSTGTAMMKKFLPYLKRMNTAEFPFLFKKPIMWQICT